MAYRNFIRRKISDEILHNKAFNIAKNPKYDLYMETCFNGLQMF